MNELQVILVVALSATAIVMAGAFTVLHRKERQMAQARTGRVGSPGMRFNLESLLTHDAKKAFMEVWMCPHCNKLSRIARACKWCLHTMPKEVKFLTVPEKEYIDQFSLPDPGRGSVPPPGEQPA